MQIRNDSVSVGTTQISVTSQVRDRQRELITFVNTSTAGQVITLSLQQEASAGFGIILYPAGSWSESVDSAFIPAPFQWYAVASAAGGTLAIHERLKD